MWVPRHRDIYGWGVWSHALCADFYRRLTRNPGYYHLEDASEESVAAFLSDIVEATLCDLQNAVRWP